MDCFWLPSYQKRTNVWESVFGKRVFWLFSCSLSKLLEPVPLPDQVVDLSVHLVQSWKCGLKASGPQRWRGWGQKGGDCPALVFVPFRATTHETSAPLRPETAASEPYKTTKMQYITTDCLKKNKLIAQVIIMELQLQFHNRYPLKLITFIYAYCI